jgi:hypothetical protein
MKKPGAWPGLFLLCPSAGIYFCCSLGLSAGFGGLFWVCCCGVAGFGLEGFCGSDAEIVTFVMVISLHEKKTVMPPVRITDVHRERHKQGASRAYLSASTSDGAQSFSVAT